MQVRAKNDKKILDVFYDLEDSYGRKFYIKQSYPEDSQPFQNLATALAAAGVPDGSTVDKAIGTVEILELDFITPNSDFGMNIYSHILPSVAKEAAQKIGDLVYEAG
ncbi:MAG: hypothetical protein IKW10_05150 [Oscillospiraceae bacterium]|nr:hypothetical protein [Oscillospiraceae bacterium]